MLASAMHASFGQLPGAVSLARHFFTASIPLSFPSLIVWGANTGVGKTLVSAGLAAAAARGRVHLLYLKPVQTGFPTDSDAALFARVHGHCQLLHGPHAAALVSSHAPTSTHPSAAADEASRLAAAKTLFAWNAPISPHVAVEREGRLVDDDYIVRAVLHELDAFDAALRNVNTMNRPQAAPSLALVETAGGVASPNPSGSLQCDALRTLRLPALLVGDGRLGGISATLCAYDSLVLRGYDVPFVTVPNQGLGNYESIQRHVGSDTVVIPLPACPAAWVAGDGNAAAASENEGDADVAPVVIDPNLRRWLNESAEEFDRLLELVHSKHVQRLEALENAAVAATDTLWWPFTQHGTVERDGVTVIDSRAGEHFTVYEKGDTSSGRGPALRLQYDACASWWTQGLTGEAQSPGIPRAVASAAGRYGHVIFPQAAHQPALTVAQKALDIAGTGWASRVFFSDDGSTAVEVALKMAFRKFAIDRGLLLTNALQGSASPPERESSSAFPDAKPSQPSTLDATDLHVLGLEGAYHGDTLGAMDAVAPSIFNGPLQTPWFRGRGLFLDPPTVALQNGRWRVRLPASININEVEANVNMLEFDSLEAVFDHTSRKGSALVAAYQAHITNQLATYNDTTHAAVQQSCRSIGACIIEPVLQGAGGMRLIDPGFQRAMIAACRQKGIPVIFDEVFTGLWRLGVPTAGALLGMRPDVGCYAKLLTGGAVPLALTLAREDVFDAFKGDAKAYALLHGHSYTAHPVGCAAAVHALQSLADHHKRPAESNAAGHHHDDGARHLESTPPHSMHAQWDLARVVKLSHRPHVAGITCLGTVLAVELSSKDAGYASGAALEIVKKLRRLDVYARPLGNVVYLMVTPMTSKQQCDALLDRLEEVLSVV